VPPACRGRRREPASGNRSQSSGVERLIRSKSSMSKSTRPPSPRPAGAGRRWSRRRAGDRGDGVLEDSLVIRSLGRRSRRSTSIASSPVLKATSLARGLGVDHRRAAGTDTHRLEGHRHRVGRELAATGAGAGAGDVSSSSSCSSVILPAACWPTASKTLLDRDLLAVQVAGRDRPAVEHQAGDVQPGERHHPGGIVLSQPVITTSPSNRWPRATSSIESVITSRRTSEVFMPLVPS